MRSQILFHTSCHCMRCCIPTKLIYTANPTRIKNQESRQRRRFHTGYRELKEIPTDKPVAHVSQYIHISRHHLQAYLGF